MRAYAFAALMSCAVMIGCGPVYRTQYTMTPPANKSGELCVNQCQQTKQSCRQSTYDRQRACLTEERAQADKAYTDYKVQQMLNKKPVWKSADDYYDPQSCSGHGTYVHVCDKDFRGCFTTCGGKVVPENVCVENCG